MTLQELIAYSIKTLKDAGVHSPETDTTLLTQYILGFTPLEQRLNAAQLLSPAQLEAYQSALQRRIRREPLQLIMGYTEFYGLTLQVKKGILIPRPETEALVSEVLKYTPNGAKVLDIGCGTGAIALALKHENPTLNLTAIDIDEEAVELTRANAQHLNLDIEVYTSNLCAEVQGQFDVIVSNPPYLPQADLLGASAELAFESERALYSGTDGLDLARMLLAQAPQYLTTGGQIFLELDPRNVTNLNTTGFKPRIFADLTHRERFIHLTAGAGITF